MGCTSFYGLLLHLGIIPDPPSEGQEFVAVGSTSIKEYDVT